MSKSAFYHTFSNLFSEKSVHYFSFKISQLIVDMHQILGKIPVFNIIIFCGGCIVSKLMNLGIFDFLPFIWVEVVLDSISRLLGCFDESAAR